MQNGLQSMLILLSGLRTVEVVKIPTRVQFFKLSDSSKSSDPLVSEEWLKEMVLPEKNIQIQNNLWLKRYKKETLPKKGKVDVLF